MTANNEQRWLMAFRVGISVVGTVTMLLVGVTGWFLVETYKTQTQFNAEIHRRVASLEMSRAATDANRFTASDWSAAKFALDERTAGLDKRVTRTEDAILSIKETLAEMKAQLDRIERRTSNTQ